MRTAFRLFAVMIVIFTSDMWANFQERGVEGKTPDFDYERYLDFMQTMGHNLQKMLN